jgi:DNA polymerase II small subunit
MAPSNGSKLKKIIEAALQYGCQLSPKALEILVNIPNFDYILREAAMDANNGIITEDILHSIQEKSATTIAKKSEHSPPPELHRESIRSTRNPTFSLSTTSALKFELTGETARVIPAEIEILNTYTSVKKGIGGIEGFHNVVKSRFKRLRALLESRPDGHGSLPLSLLTESHGNEPIKVSGMIRAVNRTKKGGLMLSLEDESGEGQCLIPKEVLKNYVPLLDTMILVTGQATESFLIAEEIAQPDIPTNFKSNYTDFPLFAVLLSDIHIGSKTFLEDCFFKVIEFFQGTSSAFPNSINQIVPFIKYILIAGDIVDGVGIYPGQEDDLCISDIRDQYEKCAELFLTIPDHIEIILIPGNHDATRLALPQPPIDKTFIDAFNQLPNVQFLGNPSSLKLHGVRFLLNHGRPMDDTIPAVPGASFQNQKEVLIQLLKARHLGPIYGEKVPYAPETNDFLVMEDIPDIWHTGHTHVNEKIVYRGVKVLNSGTFQKQTNWQKRVNINPSPGIVPFINLQTHDIIHLSFLHQS